MTIGATLLTGGGTSTDAVSVNTASITPTANRLVLVTVSFRGSASVPSISGCGITWSEVERETSGAAQHLYIFSGWSASPSSGVITIDFGADNFTSVSWSVVEFDTIDLINPVVQTNTGTGATGTSATITLAAFENALNATFGAFTITKNEGMSPGTGFTELHDLSQALDNMAVITEWRNDNDTSVTVSWGTDSGWRGIAVELREESVSPPEGGDGSFFF